MTSENSHEEKDREEVPEPNEETVTNIENESSLTVPSSYDALKDVAPTYRKIGTNLEHLVDEVDARKPRQLPDFLPKVGLEKLRDSLPTVGLEKLRDSLPTVGMGKLPDSLAAVGMAKIFSDQQKLDLGRIFATITGSAYKTRVNVQQYAETDPPKSPYSRALTSTDVYFKDSEKRVDSFEDLNEAIATLIKNVGNLRLVWRGQANAAWGVHNGLYRKLMSINDVKGPEEEPEGEQSYPTEEQMIVAEELILKEARTNWRFDGLSALETFARIQHEGGLTRLLDVTKNPYIAVWFAVQLGEHEKKDGRIVVFATSPVSSSEELIEDLPITLDDSWGGYQPPWHGWSDEMRQQMDWGTGGNRRIWVPPIYHDRIAAQNAAFLLDGVPITAYKVRKHLYNADKKPWNRSDILAASSVISKFLKPTSKPRPNGANLAPTYTFRIASDAKKEIREMLTSRFGYTRASIYPDMSEFAQYTHTLPLPKLDDIQQDELFQ